MSPSSSPPPPSLPLLPPEDLDNLIDLSRTADLPALHNSLTALSQTHNCTPAALISRAIDTDPADGSGSGNTLLHYAAANGHADVVGYFLRALLAVDPGSATQSEDLPGGTGDTPISSRDHHHSSPLVNHRNASGNTPLHWASLNGRLEVVKALVQTGGADTRVRNERGWDAVYAAVNSGIEGAEGCAEWLVEWNADADARGVNGDIGAGGGGVEEGAIDDGGEGEGDEGTKEGGDKKITEEAEGVNVVRDGVARLNLSRDQVGGGDSSGHHRPS